MIFYKRMIGDIQRKTSALSCAEMGIYDRFLDEYYSLEEPLPLDFDDLFRIARAMTKDEQLAVKKVIARFFTKTERGYEQGKAEEMISEAQPKIAAARTNGAKGGRPKKPKPETQKKPSGLLNGNPNETQGETQTEPNRKASQSQNQNTGIQTVVAKEKNSVCAAPHTQFSNEYREAAKARPDLDIDLVWANFNDHYPEGKRTLSRWRQWLQNERGPVENGGAPSVADPDSRASVEALAASKGIPPWDGYTEQWPAYKARVRGHVAQTEAA